MELRNSVWNELCATVGRTTIKMNAHFVPWFFFICWQQRTLRTLVCRVCLLAGDPKSRNDGTAEWRNHGTAENDPKS